MGTVANFTRARVRPAAPKPPIAPTHVVFAPEVRMAWASFKGRFHALDRAFSGPSATVGEVAKIDDQLAEMERQIAALRGALA